MLVVKEVAELEEDVAVLREGFELDDDDDVDCEIDVDASAAVKSSMPSDD